MDIKVSRDEIKKMIVDHIERYRKAQEFISDLNKMFNMSPESSLNDLVYSLLDGERKAISKLCNDSTNFIEWYIWENDCGDKGMEAGFDKDLKPIKTVDDLLDLIL